MAVHGAGFVFGTLRLHYMQLLLHIFLDSNETIHSDSNMQYGGLPAG